MSNYSIAVTNGIFMIFGSLITLLLSSHFQNNSKRKEELLIDVRKSNEAFLEYLISVRNHLADNSNEPLEKLQRMWKYGTFSLSENAIIKWNLFMDLCDQGNHDQAFMEFSNFILLIRKELGHKGNLTPNAMLRFLNIHFEKKQ